MTTAQFVAGTTCLGVFLLASAGLGFVLIRRGSVPNQPEPDRWMEHTPWE